MTCAVSADEGEPSRCQSAPMRADWFDSLPRMVGAKTGGRGRDGNPPSGEDADKQPPGEDGDNPPPGAGLGRIEDPPNSEYFLSRARQGDKAARDELVLRYEARVTRVVSACMGSDLARFVDMKDVVQHTLAVALDRIAKFEYRGPGSILKWLTTIAVHYMNDARKKMNARKGTQSLEDGCGASDSSAGGIDPKTHSHGPATNAALRDEVAKFDECVSKLPDGWREVVTLRYYGELSFAEIARTLGEGTEEAAWQRFNRAYVRVLSCWERPRSEDSAA